MAPTREVFDDFIEAHRDFTDRLVKADRAAVWAHYEDATQKCIQMFTRYPELQDVR